METIKKKLLDFGVLEVKTHNGKEHWKPREHRKIICNDNLEILQKYNYTIRGFHNYYDCKQQFFTQLLQVYHGV